MKIALLIVLVGIGLGSCSEPEKSNVEYNKGRQRAEMEGCHCNTALPRKDGAEDTGSGRSWTDGYVEACILFRRERGC